MEVSLFDEEYITPIEKESSFSLDEIQSIVLKSNVTKDEYTDYIQDSYDLKVGEVSKVCIPNKLHLESLGDWNIGVICGSSGSGKTTILKHLAMNNGCTIDTPKFDNNIALISNFKNLSPKDATLLLSQMGLASVPTWIRPFCVLSNGEQYRASLAKQVSDANEEDIIFIDEYTSVVDRTVAMSMSNALQKYIRRHNKRIILATCHYDIFEWLRPDWIYDLNKGGTLEKGDYLRRKRPQIELQVYRTTTDTWERFKKYHYMTSDLNSTATCFVFTWNDKLVGFVATLTMPNGSIKNGIRGHRTVVLPDYQGLGIGSKITEFIAGIYKRNGQPYYTKTVNPALGFYRENSPNWKATGYNMKSVSLKTIDTNDFNGLYGLTRKSFCHKYIGEPIYGYEDLLLSTEQLRLKIKNENQLTLF